MLAVAAALGTARGADLTLTITPAKIEFGPQALNSESRPATITVANRSNSSVPLTEVISSGIDFISKNDCGRQLAPGAQCQIQVVFKPVISGERMGVVEVLDAGSDNPYFVTLSGTGQTPSTPRTGPNPLATPSQ